MKDRLTVETANKQLVNKFCGSSFLWFYLDHRAYIWVEEQFFLRFFSKFSSKTTSNT